MNPYIFVRLATEQESRYYVLLVVVEASIECLRLAHSQGNTRGEINMDK